MYKLLLIDDDLKLIQNIRHYLGDKDYFCHLATDAKSGLRILENQLPDLIILDHTMASETGLQLLKKIRSLQYDTPVLFLSGTDNIEHICKALTEGADDYVTKPFSMQELRARIDKLLVRPPISKGHIEFIQDLQLDQNTLELKRGRTRLPLRKREFELIYYLSKYNNSAVSRSQILSNVWGDKEPFSGTIDVHISNIRRKVKKVFKCDIIKTVHGIGYQIRNGRL